MRAAYLHGWRGQADLSRPRCFVFFLSFFVSFFLAFFLSLFLSLLTSRAGTGCKSLSRLFCSAQGSPPDCNNVYNNPRISPAKMPEIDGEILALFAAWVFLKHVRSEECFRRKATTPGATCPFSAALFCTFAACQTLTSHQYVTNWQCWRFSEGLMSIDAAYELHSLSCLYDLWPFSTTRSERTDS